MIPCVVFRQFFYQLDSDFRAESGMCTNLLELPCMEAVISAYPKFPRKDFSRRLPLNFMPDDITSHH
jgi:hypothetical protein